VFALLAQAQLDTKLSERVVTPVEPSTAWLKSTFGVQPPKKGLVKLYNPDGATYLYIKTNPRHDFACLSLVVKSPM